MSLQQDHSLSLALPLPPGHVTPEKGLKQDGRPALHAVLRVELAGPNLSLQPGKAMLDLEIDRTNDSQSCLFYYRQQRQGWKRQVTILKIFLPLYPLQYF